MIVLSDTGPLLYLFLVGHFDVLPVLYGHIIVPRAIIEIELADPSTPQDLRRFLLAPPSWLVVKENPQAILPEAASLGLGERCAISLAVDMAADLLLCDDRAARRVASSANLPTVGTLGIISHAAHRKLLDFEKVLSELTTRTNFRHDAALVERVRQQHRASLRSQT